MADMSDVMALQYMNNLPENRRAEFQMAFQTQKKDRTTALLLGFACIFGFAGIDRFYLGQPLLGAIKFCTCGGVFIWAIIDWFLIMSVADKKNMETLLMLQAAYPPKPQGSA